MNRMPRLSANVVPSFSGSLDKNAQDVGTGIVGAPACGDVMKLQVRDAPPAYVWRQSSRRPRQRLEFCLLRRPTCPTHRRVESIAFLVRDRRVCATVFNRMPRLCRGCLWV